MYNIEELNKNDRSKSDDLILMETSIERELFKTRELSVIEDGKWCDMDWFEVHGCYGSGGCLQVVDRDWMCQAGCLEVHCASLSLVTSRQKPSTDFRWWRPWTLLPSLEASSWSPFTSLVIWISSSPGEISSFGFGWSGRRGRAFSCTVVAG